MIAILTTISSLFYFGYVAYIVKNYGVLGSISESYYHLSQKRKYLFTMFIFGTAVPLMLLGTWIFFLSGAMLCFVGVATEYRNKVEGMVHNVGVALAIILGLIGLMDFGVIFPLLYSLGAWIWIEVFHKGWKTKGFWEEIIVFTLIILGLYAS